MRGYADIVQELLLAGADATICDEVFSSHVHACMHNIIYA